VHCFYLLLRSRNFGKKGKESCGFRAAQEVAARERPEKKTEKAGFTSRKTFERQKVTAAISARTKYCFLVCQTWLCNLHIQSIILDEVKFWCLFGSLVFLFFRLFRKLFWVRRCPNLNLSAAKFFLLSLFGSCLEHLADPGG
jgi:hypothetical protein